MKILMFILLTILSARGAASADENVSNIPVGLYEALNSVLREDDFLKRNLRRQGVDTTISISEIDPGIPVEYFQLKKNQLKDALDQVLDIDVNAPVMSLVEPSCSWLFYIKARGQWLFTVNFMYKNEKWVWAGTWKSNKAWEEVRAEYPESTGVRPVVIIGPPDRSYIHFPHVNDHNLTWMIAKELRDKFKKQLQPENKIKLTKYKVKELEDEISVCSDTYDSASLIDSRITLNYFKKSVIRVRERQEEMRKQREK